MRTARKSPIGGLWVGLLSLVAFASLAVSMTAHGATRSSSASPAVASVEGAAATATDTTTVQDPPFDGDGAAGDGGGRRGGRDRR